jgi:hypothetical protein
MQVILTRLEAKRDTCPPALIRRATVTTSALVVYCVAAGLFVVGSSLQNLSQTGWNLAGNAIWTLGSVLFVAGAAMRCGAACTPAERVHLGLLLSLSYSGSQPGAEEGTEEARRRHGGQRERNGQHHAAAATPAGSGAGGAAAAAPPAGGATAPRVLIPIAATLHQPSGAV